MANQPEITHLGAENCVTGSCHLLQANGVTMLVDCGLCQGNDSQIPIPDWPVTPAEIDFLFLTHAHIDHIGGLPDLIDNGFAGEIICTHATKALLSPMLSDAMGFSSRTSREIDSSNRTIHELAWGFEYKEQFSLKNGISFKLKNAGHILGSCFIRFESPAPVWSITFSGDLGAANTPILVDPDDPEPCDLLILESTYGNRIHENRQQRIQRLGQTLEQALADKGKVFIPAFALGRTQELIYEMDRLFSDSEYRAMFSLLTSETKIPVFVDSPLGLDITGIYATLSEYWDKESKGLFNSGDHPIDFDHLYAVKNRKDHERLLDIPGPAVIIAGSGMCTGGRVIDHLFSGLDEPANDIFFVGYQARGTPGRDIMKYSSRQDGYVQLNGHKVPIKAKVHTLSGYSAHADQKGLVDWVDSMPEKPGKIKLVHGDHEARHKLAAVLENKGHMLATDTHGQTQTFREL